MKSLLEYPVVKAALEIPAVKWVLARVEEPSTWSGTSTIAVLLLFAHTPGPLEGAILAFGAALGGLLSVILPEKST